MIFFSINYEVNWYKIKGCLSFAFLEIYLEIIVEVEMNYLTPLDGFVQVQDGCAPITALSKDAFIAWKKEQSPEVQSFLDFQKFTAEPKQFCLISRANGVEVVVGVDLLHLHDTFRVLPNQLPQGDYYLQEGPFSEQALAEIYLAWGLGCYEYINFKLPKRTKARLFIAEKQSFSTASDAVKADFLVRDLINTPNDDLGPENLANVVKTVAEEYQAEFSQTVGSDLLVKNFPGIHAVGRCSTQEPRLLEMSWGDKSHPEVVLIGKGVCFDSGGMDLKPPAGMLRMKKDMAGAAHSLGMAKLIMAYKLPVRLRLLIPAVRNGIGKEAYCPGDVIKTRAGFSVEVNNTDAEGRLILGDALAYAAQVKPSLVFNFATLTGARALGPDMAAMFTRQDELARALDDSADSVGEKFWRLPLHEPYHRFYKSAVADMKNSSEQVFAGAMFGALYLAKNVPEDIQWAHFDLYAWQDDDKPGYPAGGRVDLLHRIVNFLKDRF